MEGLRVLHPDAIGDSEVENAFHVHALMHHYAPSCAVTEWAAARGFSGLLFPADLYRIPGFKFQNYWLAAPVDTMAKIDLVEAFHDALGDEESRVLLRDLVLYRLTTDPRLHPKVMYAEAYSPDFLPIFDTPITFVDGGAYTGDSLEALLRRGVKVEDWIAFEPDAENMIVLRETANRYKDRVGSCTLIQSGLADHAGRMAFSDGEGEASHMISSPDRATMVTHVDIVRADDFITEKPGLYIKLDIEGAEMAALQGMPKLLSSKPILAVSIYHKPFDLWEIPLYLMRCCSGSEFRMRQHGHHGFDTVLYMFPKKRGSTRSGQQARSDVGDTETVDGSSSHSGTSRTGAT